MRIVMDDKTIDSFTGHMVIETMSALCEKKKISFEETFLKNAKKVKRKSSDVYSFNVVLTVDEIAVPIEEFCKHLESYFEQAVAEKAAELANNSFGEILEDW